MAASRKLYSSSVPRLNPSFRCCDNFYNVGCGILGMKARKLAQVVYTIFIDEMRNVKRNCFSNSLL